MKVAYDKAFDVALGNTRKTKLWKNKPLMWSDLLDRLSTPTRTAETMAEYKAMGKERQSDVKDVGGFVGGYCDNGSRSHIRHRSILCLDADFADPGLWSDWQLLYGNSAAVYSTHKHTPEKPRLRLVVPLSRNVTTEEYVAIGRRVADTLGIDQFDDTSYQPQRMMYWPSCSQDGEFVFEYTEGTWLDPDTVLATYHDWRDISSWPVSSRETEASHRAKETKQKDPTTKKGLLGAFCRAYTIQDAIAEFIPEYQPCGEGRYTYTEGTTAAGVVIYEDKFSFSHHATDPASSQLCNAWDLVRLHRFGDLDEDCDPSTAPTARPSYKAMCDMVVGDDRTQAQVLADRQAEAAADFQDLGAAEAETRPAADWAKKPKLDKRGKIENTIDNIVIILTNDKRLADRISLNRMDHQITVTGPTPWDPSEGPRAWSDQDDAGLRHYLERTYSVSAKDKTFDAVNVVALRRAFHPVKDFLDSCQWDGTPRLDTLLVDYLGAEDSAYTRAVTRKALVAAVARIYRPGTKFDYMLTLRGRQGLGKSALIAKLGGKWFSDTFTTVQGKEAYEQVLGVWIVEVGELAGMRKAEAETIKLFISKTSDRFRPAYGRRQQEFPRQCVFIGTTNEQQFLRDATGNRRFWVVDTPDTPRLSIWDDLDDTILRQIWGEAKHYFQQGEPLYLPKHLEAEANKVQSDYQEEDPKVGIVSDYLDRLLPPDWMGMDLYQRRQWLDNIENVGTERRETVSLIEIWAEALGKSVDRFDRYSGAELRNILANMPEWVRVKDKFISTGPYGRQRFYKRRDCT